MKSNIKNLSKEEKIIDLRWKKLAKVCYELDEKVNKLSHTEKLSKAQLFNLRKSVGMVKCIAEDCMFAQGFGSVKYFYGEVDDWHDESDRTYMARYFKETLMDYKETIDWTEFDKNTWYALNYQNEGIGVLSKQKIFEDDFTVSTEWKWVQSASTDLNIIFMKQIVEKMEELQ